MAFIVEMAGGRPDTPDFRYFSCSRGYAIFEILDRAENSSEVRDHG